MSIKDLPDMEAGWRNPGSPASCHGGIPPAERRPGASGQLPVA